MRDGQRKDVQITPSEGTPAIRSSTLVGGTGFRYGDDGLAAVDSFTEDSRKIKAIVQRSKIFEDIVVSFMARLTLVVHAGRVPKWD
jgi:hypothetical protein